MSEVPFKIIHISDLHICDPDSRGKIEKLLRKINKMVDDLAEFKSINHIGNNDLIGAFNKDDFNLDVEFHSPDKLEKLLKAVEKENPNVVCVTGDITTLGDPKSIRLAKDLVINRLSKTCTVLVVPGNHDFLLMKYVKDLKSFINGIMEANKSTVNFIDSSLKVISISEKMKNLFPTFTPDEIKKYIDRFASLRKEYERFNDTASALNELIESISQDNQIDIRDDKRYTYKEFCKDCGVEARDYYEDMVRNDDYSFLVKIFLLNSTSDNWILMNRGVWSNKIDHIKEAELADDIPEVRIVMLHHHPLSSSKVKGTLLESAYNGMEGGEQFLYLMQKYGINLILHGHQHKESLYKMDFKSNKKGHIYVAGVPTAAVRNDNNCGFSSFKIENDLSVIHHPWIYEYESYEQEKLTNMILDPAPIDDKKTKHARREIRSYRYGEKEDQETWKYFFEKGGEVIYHFGVDHEGFFQDSTISRFKDYIDKFKSKSVKKLCILINNDQLFDAALKSRKSKVTPSLSTVIHDLWGSEESLKGCRNNIRHFKEEYKLFLSDLRTNMPSTFNLKENVVLKETLSLIPYSATLINPEKYDARMIIKLLPYGALYLEQPSKRVNKPVIMLEKRRDKYLFKYYWDHLEAIWERSDEVC